MKKLLFSLIAIAALVGCDEKTDEPVVYNVEIEPAAVTLFTGDTKTLNAAIEPATNMSLIWASSDDAVVEVDDNGTVTAISAGEATVTAALNCADGYFEGECKVSVLDTPTVTLDTMSAVIGTGDTKTIVATVVPALGGGISVDWQSSDNSIVTVADGVITAIEAGYATVTASVTLEGRTFSENCAVTVQNPIISLDKTAASLAKGKTMTIEATVAPATERTLAWESSDTSVATVADGVVTAIAEGSTTITASIAAGDKIFEGKCELTVKQGYEIGQIIDFDGVKGIVFWLTDGDTAGKAASFDEVLGLLWGDRELNCNAHSEDDGEDNTNKIKEVGIEYHPAAKWCIEHGKGWYLPACNEGIELVTKAGILNPILTANGGTTIKDSAYDWYWSSTEGESAPDAEVICFYGGTSSGHSYGDFKRYPEYDNLTRAVRKF